MNTGIITSFVVGGLLLLSMITLNSQLMRFSSNSATDLMTSERLESIIDILENDFQKIGHNIPGGLSPFVIVQDQHIEFRADTYFSDNRPYSVVSWNFNDYAEYTSSPNPNDYELTRSDNASSGSGNSTFVVPVTHFQIEYLDQAGSVIGNPSSNKEKIRQLRVEIIIESLESSGKSNDGTPVYGRAVYSKTFYPENLQFLNQ